MSYEQFYNLQTYDWILGEKTPFFYIFIFDIPFVIGDYSDLTINRRHSEAIKHNYQFLGLGVDTFRVAILDFSKSSDILIPTIQAVFIATAVVRHSC